MTLNDCNKEVTWKKIISRRLSERIKKVTKIRSGWTKLKLVGHLRPGTIVGLHSGIRHVFSQGYI